MTGSYIMNSIFWVALDRVCKSILKIPFLIHRFASHEFPWIHMNCHESPSTVYPIDIYLSPIDTPWISIAIPRYSWIKPLFLPRNGSAVDKAVPRSTIIRCPSSFTSEGAFSWKYGLFNGKKVKALTFWNLFQPSTFCICLSHYFSGTKLI